MAAFAHGLALGSDGLECDVHLSRDGVPVVIHDPTLERTTNEVGRVSGLTARELAEVDAGSRFSRDAAPWRGQATGVPRLEEVLSGFPEVPVIIELKLASADLARAVLTVIRRANAIDRVCVGSFYRAGLDVLRREEPTLATSASEHEVRWTLYRSWCRWPGRVRPPYRAFQVPEHAGRLRVVSPAFLAQTRRSGTRVDVWVVDAAEEVTRFFDWGVDGVISDRPDVAVAARAQWRLRSRNSNSSTNSNNLEG